VFRKTQIFTSAVQIYSHRLSQGRNESSDEAS
jgi:hypothetical protein